jgi:hypothetical protein
MLKINVVKCSHLYANPQTAKVNVYQGHEIAVDSPLWCEEFSDVRGSRRD